MFGGGIIKTIPKRQQPTRLAGVVEDTECVFVHCSYVVVDVGLKDARW
jgi:hypothetical protein